MPATLPDDTENRLWRAWTLLFWLVGVAALLTYRWNAIHWFALGDTDDNIRYAQVEAWLNGQRWYDLRQYKLDPPGGANIHWSRLVDLPIAGIILLVRPFAGGFVASKAAAALAPLIPLGLAVFATALAARRLVAPGAFALAVALIFCAQSTLAMFMPLRIDHHGWQLALLALTVAATADPDRRRGGLTGGAAIALSLTIGLEMLPYLALACGAVALRWVADRDEAPRMTAHGVALAVGSSLGYLLFASYDNRAPVCDALSPVWLSAVLLGGALLVLLGRVRDDRIAVRLAAAVAAAGIVGVGFALAWPDCLAAPEHLSPELKTLWFDHVREARPIYTHGWRSAVAIAALPIVGLIGCALACRRVRGTPLLGAWATITALTAVSAALLLWQTRAAPPAQLLAVPGMTVVGWALLTRTLAHRQMLVRVFGSVAAFLLVSGIAVGAVVNAIPNASETAEKTKGSPASRINLANRRCPTLPALRPLARIPAATVLTFIDLGPRLIATTHHRAIAGPYHRNQAALLDVLHAFRQSPAVAHDVMVRHGATLLLICPGMSESTVYMAEAKRGFYAQLAHGQVPPWLQPVALPKGSPFRLWRRVDGPAAAPLR